MENKIQKVKFLHYSSLHINVNYIILTVILKESAKKCSESICENVLNEDDWKIGKTKVFLKVLR